MEPNVYYTESVPNLREVVSPRELTSLLTSFAKFLDTPVWMTDIVGKLYASASDAGDARLSKTFNFPPPEEILSGESRFSFITVEDRHLIVVPINVPEGVAGVLAAEATADFQKDKFETLRVVIEALMRAGWKNAMTSEMHTAAMNVSHKELEEQNRRLNLMLKKLRGLDEVKSTFMQTISHELKTPLTSIIGYAELLAEGIAGDVNGEQKEYLKTILDKGQLLLEMITNVLDITRMGAKEDLKLNMHNVEELINAAIEATSSAAQTKNIEIAFETDGSLRPVMVDNIRITRAVAALLSNAVKFSPEGSKVSVKAIIKNHPRLQSVKTPFELPEEEVMAITVMDNGIGIPTEEAEKIFGSFYQVDNSSTREYGGSGLGLTITKNFVEAHNGKIEVTSVVGRGSRFTILIPTQMQD